MLFAFEKKQVSGLGNINEQQLVAAVCVCLLAENKELPGTVVFLQGSERAAEGKFSQEWHVSLY